MLQILLDLLFPRRSLSGDEGDFITPAERAQLKSWPVVDHQMSLRNRGLEAIDCIRAGSAYAQSPLLKKAIRTFKYQRIPGFAEDLADLVTQALPDDPFLAEAVLCPVPLHWSRQWQRGFNQAELLAQVVAQRRELQLEQLLKRHRATGHQAWRGRAERLTAVQGAFRFVGSTVPTAVILVDDLATTGATLEACAVELKRVGVQWVEGWVVAHG